MPRKSAILKITVTGIPKDWRWQLDNLKRLTPVPGTEEHYARYVGMVEKRLTQHARFDQACDLYDAHMTDDARALMREEGKLLDQRMSAEMGALDRWRYACEHLNDKVLVAEEEVRAVVLASLSDKLEGIDFSLNHGLLGSKVAQAIRKNVSEETMEAPLCREHAL